LNWTEVEAEGSWTNFIGQNSVSLCSHFDSFSNISTYSCFGKCL